SRLNKKNKDTNDCIKNFQIISAEVAEMKNSGAAKSLVEPCWVKMEVAGMRDPSVVKSLVEVESIAGTRNLAEVKNVAEAEGIVEMKYIVRTESLVE
ncbi:36344_t:CDS:2, partial [Racocetra persica]